MHPQDQLWADLLRVLERRILSHAAAGEWSLVLEALELSRDAHKARVTRLVRRVSDRLK